MFLAGLIVGGIGVALWASRRERDHLDEERDFWSGYHEEYVEAVHAALTQIGASLSAEPMMAWERAVPFDDPVGDHPHLVGWRVRTTAGGRTVLYEHRLHKPSSRYPFVWIGDENATWSDPA